ncbi:putative reverse transcriptase domain-containing protein, partial [Tanacetum coccineum]
MMNHPIAINSERSVVDRSIGTNNPHWNLFLSHKLIMVAFNTFRGNISWLLAGHSTLFWLGSGQLRLRGGLYMVLRYSLDGNAMDRDLDVSMLRERVVSCVIDNAGYYDELDVLGGNGFGYEPYWKICSAVSVYLIDLWILLYGDEDPFGYGADCSCLQTDYNGMLWVEGVTGLEWYQEDNESFIAYPISAIMPPRRLKKKSVKRLVEKRVAKAIEEYEKSRANLDSAGSSGGNLRNAGGTVNVQGCSHKTFTNGKPHSFNGTEGVVGLRRWIEKVEQVFEICKCTEEDKVMFAASTFEGPALTWMEQELWTLTLKRDDIEAYNNHFHELALMCPELVPTKKKKIERYTRGFPERIKGNITSSKPSTLHDAINMARELVEQAVQGRATRIGESNKRKWEDHQRNTNNNNPNNNNNNNNNRNRNNNYHQQQNRRQETARAYAAAPAEGRGYAGNLPKCNRCNSHHNGRCPPKCQKCQRTGHQEKDCRVRVPGAGVTPLQDVTCYGCGEKGHFK